MQKPPIQYYMPRKPPARQQQPRKPAHPPAWETVVQSPSTNLPWRRQIASAIAPDSSRACSRNNPRAPRQSLSSPAIPIQSPAESPRRSANKQARPHRRSATLHRPQSAMRLAINQISMPPHPCRQIKRYFSQSSSRSPQMRHTCCGSPCPSSNRPRPMLRKFSFRKHHPYPFISAQKNSSGNSARGPRNAPAVRNPSQTPISCVATATSLPRFRTQQARHRTEMPSSANKQSRSISQFTFQESPVRSRVFNGAALQNPRPAASAKVSSNSQRRIP